MHWRNREKRNDQEDREKAFFFHLAENFAIFTGKHLCWSLFLINLQNWRLVFSLKKTLEHRRFLMNIARFLKTASLWNTCSLYISYKFINFITYKFYGILNIRYLKAIFCYCKIRPCSRIDFTIDRSKFLVKRCFFLNQDFSSPSKIFLLFNHFAFAKICKELKLQRETSGSNWTILVSNFSKNI